LHSGDDPQTSCLNNRLFDCGDRRGNRRRDSCLVYPLQATGCGDKHGISCYFSITSFNCFIPCQAQIQAHNSCSNSNQQLIFSTSSTPVCTNVPRDEFQPIESFAIIHWFCMPDIVYTIQLTGSNSRHWSLEKNGLHI